MNDKILKRLREKIIKGVNLADGGPPLSGLFLLIQDINYLYFCLLRELGDLSSQGYLSSEILSTLIKVEPVDGNKIITLGEGLLGHSDGELLHGADLFPLICLHTLPDSVDLIFSGDEKRIIPVRQLSEKERIIALLLEHIRSMKEK